MSTAIHLSAPITAFGDPVTSLALKDATGEDLRLAGFPFRFGRDVAPGGQPGMRQIQDGAATRALLTRLCAVPAAALDGLEASDWLQLVGALSAQCVLAPCRYKLRRIKGRELAMIGQPFTGGRAGEQVVDAPVVAALIAALSDQTQDEIDALPAGEWAEAMFQIMGFFAATTPASSGVDISTKPDGGATSPM